MVLGVALGLWAVRLLASAFALRRRLIVERHVRELTEMLGAERMVAEPGTSYERSRNQVHAQLTDREIEFVRLVCDEAELTYDQVSERMHVHRRTVDNFRIALFDKFGIKSKTGLVLFAFKWRIVEP